MIPLKSQDARAYTQVLNVPLVAATQGSDGPSASGNTHDECAPLSPSSIHHGVWSLCIQRSGLDGVFLDG